MFHAVSQLGADDDDLLSPVAGNTALPMFSESGLSSSRLSRGTSRGAAKGIAISSEDLPPISHGKRELRSRKSGGMELTSMSQKFIAPDPTGGFEDPGTFRWESTATSGSTEHNDEITGDEKGEDEVQPRGVGLPLRGKRTKMRFRPPPPELENASSASRPWYIMVPDSRTHQLFDHLGDLLTMYVVIAIPLFVSFQHIENMHAEDWYAFNVCVDFLFVVDLMGRFLTAYYDDTAGRLVFQPVSILRQYASGLLVPDLIASVPLTVILGIKMYTISNKVTRLVRLPQTIRLVRSIKMLSEEAEEARHKNILLAAYNVVKVVMYILLVMHWVACGWHLLADVEDAELSWIVKDGLEGAHASKLYVTSVYWTVTTLSTVGYGDIFASTIAERTYCILVMLTGATMYALAIGSVSQIIAQVVHRHSVARRIERHAEVFITMHKLPQDLAVQIMRTLNISGETQPILKQQAQDTLELVPPAVRRSALLCIYRSQIARIPFLRNRRDVNPEFVASLARSLHSRTFAKAGEDVMMEESNVEQMIFLVRGRAIVTRRGVQVGRMNAGSCFGVSAAMQRCRRRESVTCVTDCEVYIVDGSALRVLARAHPSQMAELRAESEQPLSFSSKAASSSAKKRAFDGSTSVAPDSTTPLWLKDRDDMSEPRSLALSGGEYEPSRGDASTKSTLMPRWRSFEKAPASLEKRRASVGGVETDVAGAGSSPGGAIQELERCLSEAGRAEAEVWDRLHLLNESLTSMRDSLNYCRVVHEQMLEHFSSERVGSEVGEGSGQSLSVGLSTGT